MTMTRQHYRLIAFALHKARRVIASDDMWRDIGKDKQAEYLKRFDQEVIYDVVAELRGTNQHFQSSRFIDAVITGKD